MKRRPAIRKRHAGVVCPSQKAFSLPLQLWFLWGLEACNGSCAVPSRGSPHHDGLPTGGGCCLGGHAVWAAILEAFPDFVYRAAQRRGMGSSDEPALRTAYALILQTFEDNALSVAEEVFRLSGWEVGGRSADGLLARPGQSARPQPQLLEQVGASIRSCLCLRLELRSKPFEDPPFDLTM